MADNYETYSREELLRLLRERDRKPKFGLVWERDEIEHDKSLNDDFVALDLDPALSCGDAPFENLIIEGDNFDALRYLRMTHAGRVKCIYIDPPYNTGNRDFIYNDRFVDKDDSYRHSKWLEFMYRRLVLAKDLLAEDGVIFVSIGEEEQAHLSVLMDKVFTGMKVGTFVWRRRSGANDAKGAFLSVDHEYILCYGGAKFSFSGDIKDLSGYSNPDEDPNGDWALMRITKAHSYRQRPNGYYPIYNQERDVWYPCNTSRVWALASETKLKPGQKIRTKTIETYIKEKVIVFPSSDRVEVFDTREALEKAINDGDAPVNLNIQSPDLDFFIGKRIGYGTVQKKSYAKELKRAEKPLSSWIVPFSEDLPRDEDVNILKSGMTQEGTKLIQNIFGVKAFNYPKPLSLLINLIKQTTRSGDLILDFFAGSGTTAHAVLAVNEEDDGNRRFIMVSSTEASLDEPEKNVCRDVTRSRLASVINGYTYKIKTGNKNVEGLGGSFAYLRIKRIPISRVFNDIQHEQVWHALQLIHGAALTGFDPGALVHVSGKEDDKLVYVPKLTGATVAEVARLAGLGGRLVVYSWQPGLLRQRIETANVAFEKIPEYLVSRFGVVK